MILHPISQGLSTVCCSLGSVITMNKAASVAPEALDAGSPAPFRLDFAAWAGFQVQRERVLYLARVAL